MVFLQLLARAGGWILFQIKTVHTIYQIKDDNDVGDVGDVGDDGDGDGISARWRLDPVPDKDGAHTLYKEHHSIYFWILDDVQEGAVHYAPKFCLRGGQRRKNNKILPCVQSL